MSYRIENNFVTGKPELVISGFENGIADSPFLGIADMRNANITSSPKQASVQFSTESMDVPPVGYTDASFSSDATTNVFTVASTSGFYEGMGLTIVTVSGTGSGTAGLTYYVGDITSTTFKLYVDVGLFTLLDVVTSRTGTFTVYTFGTPADSTSSDSNSVYSTGEAVKHTFVMTTDGLVWYISSVGSLQNTLQFTGNVLHSTVVTPVKGIVVFKDYLFAFMQQGIDYLPISNMQDPTKNPSDGWEYTWQTAESSVAGHRAISATDDVLYFCNGPAVGSVIEVAGEIFDPTDSTTYTYASTALALPTWERATCLAQLGTSLLVGGTSNYIYPWDRISTSFSYPIVCAENLITCMVTMNSSTYVFAGNRGRIYITNGSNIQEFKKIPDYLSGTTNPYFQWGWAMYWKDQLYFTVSCTSNSGSVINNFAGLWAIDIESTKALRMTNSLSYGTYAGSIPTIAPMGAQFPTGDGIFAFWYNGAGGVDYTTSNPDPNQPTIIDTDIIPIGTFLNKKNYTSLEFKLAKPLVAGETMSLSWRPNLTDDFTLLDETTTDGLLSDVYTPNFSNLQWLQLRAQYTGVPETQGLPYDEFSAGLLTSLARYYPLDGDAVDVVGGLDGTDTSISYSTSNGVILEGAGFNGTTSEIVEGTSTTISTNASITGWIKTTQNAEKPIYGFKNDSALDNDIVAYWKLDETSGNASDSVGSRTLTNNGTTTYGPGIINNGAIFNGTTQYLSRASETIGISNIWTVSCWAKFNSLGTGIYILAWDTAPGTFNQISLLKNAADQFRVVINSGVANYKDYHGNTVFTTGVFYHLAVSWDGTNLILYVNGVAETLTKDDDSAVTMTDPPRILNVGGQGGVPFFDGTIDEFGYWSKELTSAEILSLYNSGSAITYPYSSNVGFRFSLNALDSNMGIKGQLTDSDGIEALVENNTILNDGEWHFIALVKTASAVSLYVDTVLVDTSTATFTGNFGGTTMFMGNSGTDYYEGALDECGYWTKALTTAEVLELYNTTNPSYVPLLEIRLRE